MDDDGIEAGILDRDLVHEGLTDGMPCITNDQCNATNPYFESVKGVPEVQDPAPPPSEAPSEEGDVTGTDMSMDPSAVNLPPG